MINRTEETKKLARASQIEEQVKISVLEATSEGLGKLSTSLLENALNNNIGAGNYILTGDETRGWKIKVEDKIFLVNPNGKVTEKEIIISSSLTLDKSTETVKEYETIEITAIQDGTEEIEWTSSDESIAKVIGSGEDNQIGIVTGVKIGTVTITAKIENKTVTCEVTVEEGNFIGDYVNYNVTYTDMYSGYEFGATDGWRILSREIDESDATKYTVKIISTGIPAKLYYSTSTNAGNENNGWWGTDAQVEALYGSTYSTGYSDYPNRYTATGLQKNFADITFKYGTSATENNGYFSKINELTSEILKGSIFVSSEYTNIEVHNLTLAELNATRGSYSGSQADVTTTSGDIGLFYLRGLADENANFLYTSESTPAYWLASPDVSFSGKEPLYYIYSAGEINSTYKGTYGVRPVVSITGVTMEKNEEVWDIIQ